MHINGTTFTLKIERLFQDVKQKKRKKKKKQEVKKIFFKNTFKLYDYEKNIKKKHKEKINTRLKIIFYAVFP